MSNELNTLWNAFIANTWQMSVPTDTIQLPNNKKDNK